MESRLYSEAEFLYKRFPSLKPIKGNLRNWKGQITLKNKKKITLLITIPNNFPKYKPIFSIEENLVHEFIKNKVILIPLLKNWNDRLHVYQIINSILVNFNKKFPKLKKEKKIAKSETDHKQDQEAIYIKDPTFFNTDSEKKALNELLETLKTFKNMKKIDQKSFKILFSRYLNEIKNIEAIKKLIV